MSSRKGVIKILHRKDPDDGYGESSIDWKRIYDKDDLIHDFPDFDFP